MLNDKIDLEQRKAIWNALSEFYLDTELSKEDFERIALVFKNTGLELEEIKEIDRYEVFPLLQPNLLSAAGEWAGFNEAWLVENCQKRIAKRKHWFYKMRIDFWNKLFYWMRKDYWIQIEMISKN